MYTIKDVITMPYFSNKEVPFNVWLGVSEENLTFKKRIDSLRKSKRKN